jgi:hypothetical protein
MKFVRVQIVSVAALALIVAPGVPQPPNTRARPTASADSAGPRLVAVAETKLLMEGLTHANFQGLEKILKGKEIDDETWGFARGQALLIAEAGNLLMLRPPRGTGENAWMKDCGELRDSATSLAKSIATRDVERCRASLVQLAGTCNRCHQAFQVKTRVSAFESAKP